MEELIEYILPELMVLIPVLLCVGLGVKKSELIQDKFIPLILGGVGIILALLYEIMIIGFSVEAVFTAIIQGVLVAAVAVYSNQIVKQVIHK